MSEKMHYSVCILKVTFSAVGAITKNNTDISLHKCYILV